MQKLKILTVLLAMTTLFVVAGSPLPIVRAGPIAPNAVAPDLGSAASFVALAYAGVTNTGHGVFIGNVGSLTSTVTGFPPGTVIHGAIYQGVPGSAVTSPALADATTAYNNLKGQVCNVDLTGKNLGGMTLTPGVYCFNTSAQLTGNLVLDDLGNPNAVWVFQVGSTLTTAPGSSVILLNAGKAVNVFWQVGSAATIDTTTHFNGNIIADASVSLNDGASLIGRALALNGAVTLITTDAPFPIATSGSLILYLPIVLK